MKRFRYSLDTLLALRREREREREIALAAAAGALSRIDLQIARLSDSGTRIFLTGGGEFEDLKMRERYYARSIKEIQKLTVPREQAEQAWKESSEAYAEAHRERLALDRVKEKRREEWRRELKREEILLLDETARRRLKDSGTAAWCAAGSSGSIVWELSRRRTP